MTRQRIVILDKLRVTRTHPTADEIYDAVRAILPKISLGTVYRNLEVLADMGLIMKIETGGAQKRFDGDPEKHLHMRCVNCNRVFDVPSGVVVSFDYHPERSGGFTILDYDLQFTGICEACQRKLS